MKTFTDINDPENLEMKDITRVSTINFAPDWNTEEMATAQNEDADIGPIYRAKITGAERPTYQDISGGSPALKVYWSKWNRLEIRNTLLYRRWENDQGDVTRLQLIVPFKRQREISKRLHGPMGAAHLGRKKTTELISRSMFWYQMADNIKFWIQCCDLCQRRKRPGKTAKTPMREYMSGYPNERLQMDVCGPVIESYHGNKYLLVITDRFTKYTKVFPMPNQESKTIAEILVTQWLEPEGEPEELHTDQGTPFEARLMQQVCKLYDIKKTRSSPYHPQGNAQVERYNQTVASMLSMLQTDYRDWDMKLPLAVSSYNGTVNATTGFTPNKLWLGREKYSRADRFIPQNPLTEKVTPEKYVERLEDDMRVAYQVARETIGRNMKVQKRYHDRNHYTNQYKIGDAVLKRCMAPKDKGRKKFAPRWVGPFFIIDKLDDRTYRIAEDESRPRKVTHHDRLKPYFFDPDQQFDNSWVFRVTKTKVRRDGVTVSVQTETTESATADEQQVQDELADLEDCLRVTKSYVDSEVKRPRSAANYEPEVKKTVRVTRCDEAEENITNLQRRGRPRKKTKQAEIEAKVNTILVPCPSENVGK